MSRPVQRPELWVEGKNDLFSLCYLLGKHGIDIAESTRRFDVKDKGSVATIFAGMEQAIRQSRHRPIGFVIDADWTGIEDGGLQRRWNRVCSILKKLDVAADQLPQVPAAQGTILTVPKFHARVGFWLMPDNQQDGNLERFLELMMKKQLELVEHAKSASEVARGQYGAEFREEDLTKATVYTVLAWQESPGRPPGEIMAKSESIFEHGSPTAVQFVNWFRELFEIEETESDAIPPQGQS
ncbi:MAG: DUF3226 domain-containing protein [Planctomycetaceae bacterium]